MLTIGHRGAAGLMPENTLASFKKAIELKLNMIELDIHKCLSGELVVIHDYSLGRTTNKSGFVKNKTLDELKSASIKDGQKIPTLAEVLNLVKGRCRINIEIKGNDCHKELVQLIENQINNNNYKPEYFLISSFKHEQLIEFHKILPNIKIAILCHKPSVKHIKLAHSLNAESINPDFKSLNEEMVNKIHSSRLKVYAYTVNAETDKTRMEKMGVDGIFTDFPI